MTIDEKYMSRCLQIALNGKGRVSPNPMVGAVVVHENKIIGEGYHCSYGQAHAEVNAINSVKDKELLSKSTLYVSLEPCSHYGKTPPCSELIIKNRIPKVVIACADPFPSVSGRGIKMLREAGIEVVVGLLEKEAKELNKEFITAQTKDRPYVYLKWAQSKDGFIDRQRSLPTETAPAPISNDFTRILVHKMRAEVSSIMVGTNTAIKDNPSLTTRLWSGKNPIRIILDREGKVSRDAIVFNGQVETLVFTEAVNSETIENGTSFIPLKFDDQVLEHIFLILKNRNIDSVMIEGGAQLLQNLIDKQLWDEAYVEVATINLEEGVAAPQINGRLLEEHYYYGAKQMRLAPQYE